MLVFDHITKTAGTTFNESYVHVAFPRNERFILTGDGEAHIRDLNRLLDMSSEERRHLRMVGGHGIENFRFVEEPCSRHVSIIREPVQRTISHYRHFLDVPDSEAAARAEFGDRISLTDFIQYAVPDNVQARLILGSDYASLNDDIAIERRLNERFFIVGLTEDFVGFIFYLHLRADLPLCLFNNRNVRHGRIVTPSEAELDLISKRNSFDSRLYKIVRDVFYSRLNQIMTTSDEALLERFCERLNIYRDRTLNDPSQSVALLKQPQSWAALDDYRAVFLESPPEWPERELVEPVNLTHCFVIEGCDFNRNWQLTTRPAKGDFAVLVPWKLPGSEPKRARALRVLVHVTEGQLGVFLADRESKSPLSPEFHIQSTSETVEIRIPIPQTANSGYLTFRNQSSAGISRARIVSVALIEGEDGESTPIKTESTISTWKAAEQSDEQASGHRRQMVPLWNFTGCGDAMLMVKDGGLALITDTAQWSYAAQARLAIPGIEQNQRSISVRLKVESGLLGIGWLNSQGDGWVTRTSAQPVAEFQEARLVIPAGTEGGALVLDNWSEEGATRAFVREVSIVPIPDDSEMDLSSP